MRDADGQWLLPANVLDPATLRLATESRRRQHL
jgi:hypothetical protein